jgi:hypothetical protein
MKMDIVAGAVGVIGRRLAFQDCIDSEDMVVELFTWHRHGNADGRRD